MSKGCPICGASVQNEHAYCRNCGHPMWDLPPGYQAPQKLVAKPELFCSSCGVGLMNGPTYCPNCGANLPKDTLQFNAPDSSGNDGCLQGTSIIIFIFIGLPAAACGGCSLLMMTGGGINISWVTITVAAFAVFGGLLYWMIQTFRK